MDQPLSANVSMAGATLWAPVLGKIIDIVDCPPFLTVILRLIPAFKEC